MWTANRSLKLAIVFLTILLLAVLAGHFFERKRLISEIDAWKIHANWLRRCVSFGERTSAVLEAENNFIDGDKRLIQIWRGDAASVSRIPGFLGNENLVAVKSERELKARLPRQPDLDLTGSNCMAERYAEDYNLTMSRLLKLRDIGEPTGDAFRIRQ